MNTIIESLNLEAAERQLCTLALSTAGSIVEAAKLLGVTRHSLKRRIIKHKIAWPAGDSRSPHDST
jgi:transcriptional regulator of acetoin/glycerol metabolism